MITESKDINSKLRKKIKLDFLRWLFSADVLKGDEIREHFKTISIDKVKYEVVNNYETLMNLVM